MITAKLKKRSFTRTDNDNVAVDDTVGIMGFSAVNALGSAYNKFGYYEHSATTRKYFS